MNEEESLYFTISQEDLEQFKRLDAYLAHKTTDISRSLIKKLFLNNHFRSDQKLELKKMPKLGTQIEFIIPEPEAVDIPPQDIPLDILFEDQHLIIINKQAGLVVHPAPGNPDGTLVNAILFHCKDLKGIGNEKRPGIVHRLDKGTSGIMVVAKDHRTHEGLVKLFSTHDIERKYEAICLGSRLPSSERLESLIGRSQFNRLKMATEVKNGKNAITFMTLLETFSRFSHVELKLETGRTHQIRVHLAELMNSPILNDLTYGRTKEEKRFQSTKLKSILKEYEYPFLHAKLLGFIHPITKEKLLFKTNPPQIFLDILTQLRSEI
jgi:23S rRNA pseudouridine1911/1915/1917 synthase